METISKDWIKPNLQLVGEDGNAFSILGRFSKEARRAGNSKEAIQAVVDLAMAGDYNHLLRIVMAHTSDSTPHEYEDDYYEDDYDESYD